MSHILSHLSFYADSKAGTERQFLQACWSEGLLNGAIEETRAGRYILVLMGRADDGAARTYDIDIGGVDIAGRLQLAGSLRRSGGNRHALELELASVLRNLTRHLKPSAQALQRCLAALHASTMEQAGAALRQRSAPAPLISRTLSRTVSHSLAPWPAGISTAK